MGQERKTTEEEKKRLKKSTLGNFRKPKINNPKYFQSNNNSKKAKQKKEIRPSKELIRIFSLDFIELKAN